MAYNCDPQYRQKPGRRNGNPDDAYTPADPRRPQATPRLTHSIAAPQQPGPEALARWLTTAAHSAAHAAGDPAQLNPLFQIAATQPFAELWYAARDAGELLRARSLRTLYTQRTAPGGAHPDPRAAGAAFSSQAVLSSAARLLGASIWQVPEYLAAKTDAYAPTPRPTLAWLTTYPTGRPPDIAVRVTTRHRLQEFDVACLLGYLARERHRLLDPQTPAGIVLLPSDPGLMTVLHQFAIGLLALPQNCPADWRCPCNSLRLRYNAPPPDHQQATDAFSTSDVHAEIQRQQYPQQSSRQTRRLDDEVARLDESYQLVREIQDALDKREGSDPHRTKPGDAMDSGPLPYRPR